MDDKKQDSSVEEEEEEEALSDIFKLTKPFMYGEKRIEEIKLHEPTAEKAVGMKFDLPTGEGDLAVDISRFLKVINDCTTVAPTVLKKMKVSDVTLCYYQCVGLFFQE